MTELNSKLKTLYEWLDYIERIHPKSIQMGLERVNKVKSNLNFPLSFPIITVSGTNGKGSVCSILEAILSYAGYRVGCYTSPHLLRYNERIRIGQKEVLDDELCNAFSIVEAARVNSNVPLTYFEFGTLASMELISKAGVDIAILEVGLGGRLDAVNIFDAECSVLTNIDYDHTEYLGDTREKIGFEKAGIFRSGKTAVCSDISPPVSISQHAASIGAKLILIGEHFGYSVNKSSWDYWGGNNRRCALPYLGLGNTLLHQLRNASACLAALDVVRETLPVTNNNIHQGLLKTGLPGRFQILPDRPKVVLDVAHNPSAAHVLSNSLSDMGSYQKTYAVFAMLNDKDIDGVVQALISKIDVWLITGISSSRGASSEEIMKILENAGVNKVSAVFTFSDPAAAYVFACKQSTINDRICVFGSFYVVGKVMGYLEQEKYG